MIAIDIVLGLILIDIASKLFCVLQKSLSTEELSAEMANLEGLMKDLNAITQQEFEC